MEPDDRCLRVCNWLLVAVCGTCRGWRRGGSLVAIRLFNDQRLFPTKTLGLALGTYGMGIYIGSGLAFIIGGTVVGAVSGTDIILPLIGAMTGWKAVFVIVGIPGLLVALLMFTVREPFRRGLKRAGPEGKADNVPFSAVLKYVFERKRTYFSHFMGIASLSLIGYGSAVYAPLFFYTVHDSSPQIVGSWFGLAVLIMGPLGVVVGGILADQLRLKGYSDCYLRVPALAALLLIPINIAFPLVEDPFWAFAILFPGSFIGAMPFGAGPAGLQAITPNQMRAQVSALYLFTVNIIGLGIGPLIIGAMTDLFFTGEGGLRYAMIVVFTAAALWSMAVLFFGFKPFAKCVEEPEGVEVAKQF
jgi:MFS family permease